MKVTVNLNPMPAVRMTSAGMYKDPQAMAYVDYKNSLAQELKLHMMGEVKGGKVEVNDKLDRKSLPTTRLVGLKVKFARDTRRRADIDNMLKMLMDVLQTAGIIYNDDQVREVHAILEKPVPIGFFTFELNYID